MPEKSRSGSKGAGQVQFESGPGLSVIAPFFLVAPLGGLVAGLIAIQVGPEIFVAINTPRLVAITHALVLGWITTTIMGATYQLGPVVLGGRLLSRQLARVQFVVHAVAVALFVWSVRDWDVVTMGWAGSLLILSLVLYVVNAGVAVRRASNWSLSRMYLAAAFGFLVLAGGFGITWVGTLQHGWFPITFGALAAHAHLGLVGWLALTLMGVSYQLVPMFNVATLVHPRFGGASLAITATAVLVFAGVMLTDPPVQARVALAVLLAAGPLLWAFDQSRLMHGRLKRKVDVQGRATLISLAFLVLAALLGMGAAAGTPLTPDDGPARWPLAYGVAAILGWAGTAAMGNSIKIVAFLVWLYRYQPRTGFEAVPAIKDLYSSRFASAVLLAHCAATVVLVAAALSGSLTLFHAGGLMLVVSAGGFLVCLGTIVVPRRATDAHPAPAKSVAP